MFFFTPSISICQSRVGETRGRDSLNSDSCSWPEAKFSLLLMSPQAGGAVQRGPGSHHPWAADWQCGCHVSSPRCHQSIQIYFSCLSYSSWKHRCAGRRQVQCRSDPRQHTADAAGQRHHLLLHILAQAPALSAGYTIRHFPDPNREPAS